MGSYPDEFPFNIMDVVELLRLRVRRQQSNSVYVDCPFCGDRRGKMNVNFVKNVWRCNYCGEHGGMLGLYARLNNTTTSDAYWEIAEALCDNCHEEHGVQHSVSSGFASRLDFYPRAALSVCYAGCFCCWPGKRHQQDMQDTKKTKYQCDSNCIWIWLSL